MEKASWPLPRKDLASISEGANLESQFLQALLNSGFLFRRQRSNRYPVQWALANHLDDVREGTPNSRTILDRILYVIYTDT